MARGPGDCCDVVEGAGHVDDDDDCDDDGDRDNDDQGEDDVDDAVVQIEQRGITASDVVIGIAASGDTPFTCQVLAAAKERGDGTKGKWM